MVCFSHVCHQDGLLHGHGGPGCQPWHVLVASNYQQAITSHWHLNLIIENTKIWRDKMTIPLAIYSIMKAYNLTFYFWCNNAACCLVNNDNENPFQHHPSHIIYAIFNVLLFITLVQNWHSNLAATTLPILQITHLMTKHPSFLRTL